MHKVFVSYSSREADRANEIVEQLEKAGIPCWIAPRDIAVGSNYTKDIPKAIRECTHFLLALSANAEASKWVNKELTRAINQEKCLIPLMIENFTISEGFEFLLEDVQIRNYCTDCQGVLQEVIGLFPDATSSADEYYLNGLKAYYLEQYTEAIIWFRKAADLGHAQAQHDLGYRYAMGEGVEKNPAEAAKWYRDAAEQGHAQAQHNLGFCYYMGEGVEKNSAEAVKWYRSSAEQGNAFAQYNLGICYKNGRGVAVDLAEAKKWFQKAADQGYEAAKKQLATLQ